MPHLGPTCPRHPSPRHPPLPDSALAPTLYRLSPLSPPLSPTTDLVIDADSSWSSSEKTASHFQTTPTSHCDGLLDESRGNWCAIFLFCPPPFPPHLSGSSLSQPSPLGAILRLEEDGIAVPPPTVLIATGSSTEGINSGIYGTRSWLKKKGCPPLYRSFLPPVPPSFSIPFRCTRHYLDRSLDSTGWLTQSLIPIADDDRRHHDLHQALSSLRSRLRLSHENPFKSFRSPPWTRGMFGERAYWWRCWVGHC
ncbi:hypothetical protein FB45DRAFT_1060754 [Roridomyces roridus]|uniref:Uncharacterized protein n=1 Tax=Roridomyces roridus TaxID=1738132 RepID=A0AAD7BL71_9AGAR|nr:hypothetical protein FB45DRAFT_1060754 [Roridomyces roridus]